MKTNVETPAAPVTASDDLVAAEMKRLHDALCFWLPQNHAGLPDAMVERIAADAYLLVGYDDMPDPKSAEQLGWIKAVGSPAPVTAEPAQQIKSTDEARKFVDEWHKKHFPTDRTFTRYIMNEPPRQNPLAGDFAWQLANALNSMAATPAPADRDALTPALHAIRHLLDGSQPKDVPGALMVIDDVLSNRAWAYDIAPPPGFITYVQANYTGDVHFHDPKWHATRLWNAAMRNVGVKSMERAADAKGGQQ